MRRLCHNDYAARSLVADSSLADYEDAVQVATALALAELMQCELWMVDERLYNTVKPYWG